LANKEAVRINKKHGGKEFNSFFRFIGQVKKATKFENGQVKQLPIFDVTTTRTGKERRVLQFDIATTKHNRLRVERSGMEFEQATLYNSKTKEKVKIKWEDRFDKEKYPNESFHLMDTDWDMTLKLAEGLEEDMWVEVKGRYEFDTYTNDEGKELLIVKRIINSIEKIEDGQEIKFGNETFNYVCDFDSPDFKEVNYFNMQIGIKSTYQDEDTKDTKVNAVFLAYGKERSIPKDVELIVYYKEPAEGKTALADAFAKLNRLDFVEVTGVDNNRPEFAEVEEVELDESDPFADVEETVTKRKSVISGNKRGLEITGIVRGSYIKEMLTEEEIQKDVFDVVEEPVFDDPFSSVSEENESSFEDDDDLPFTFD
jgi:hypothetical protein